MKLAEWGPGSLLVVSVLGAVGCAGGGPLGRPLDASPVDTGPGSLESVRRQLAGTWDLLSYTYVTDDGTVITQAADAEMSFDEFGNLAIHGVLRGSDGQADQPVDLSTRVVIDTENECIHLADPDELGPRDLPDALDPHLPRFYFFEDDRLRLAVRDDDRDIAALVWRKRSGGAAS